MKTFILSFILIFGLAATNHGKPIIDIYSIQDPLLEEEAYVDDIPFDTRKIVEACRLEQMLRHYREECSVQDIPFNTREIASNCLLEKMMVKYRNEIEVGDIPSLCPFLWIYLSERERAESVKLRILETYDFFFIEHSFFASFSL